MLCALATSHQLETTLQSIQHIHSLTVLLPQSTLERMLLLNQVAVSTVALLMMIVTLEQGQLLAKDLVLNEAPIFCLTQSYLQADLFPQAKFGVAAQLNSLDT